MNFVTHELLIIGQILACCSYTMGSYRLFGKRFGRFTLGCIMLGVVLDVSLAVFGATSDLGDNPEGMPWRHPLFSIAVVLATLGMLGYMVNLALLSVRRWREKAEWFLSGSQAVIWPSWVAGVTIFILNVFVGWF
ncbi:MAG: hypothetical protein SCARUB_01787 [Candidatus Scalindua rubra]|uniref:Uncharacterized protein n=1 Tax=Candidatus Scalindua rubra TaxID=1872076 RepID=A0A1E3XBV7_9BACT|nr:MAG: hypothetical protein SCARUB_01787 [Candidatus Scalindua rubra]